MKQSSHSRSPATAITLLFCMLLAMSPQAFSQIVKPLSVQLGEEEQLIELKWVDMPVDAVLDEYGKLTGRTILKSPGVPVVLVTLRANGQLTETEYLVAIESMLSMNGIALVSLGSRFLKVVPIADAPKSSKETKFDPVQTEDEIHDTDELERRIITLKHLTFPEIQPIVDSMRSSSSFVQPLERANSFMIIDVASNIGKIFEIIEFLDKPFEIQVETRIYELQHAKAGEVASRLNELIQSSQQDDRGQQQRGRTAQRTQAAAPRGVQRAGSSTAAASQATARAGQSAQDLAERGIIQGDVRIVADERTNILIIISEPVNFSFFDKIVTILDKPVDPAITVEVVPLEYAEAEEISGVLNEFIGAATETRDQEQSSSSGTSSTTQGGDSRSTPLQDFIARRRAAQRASDPRQTTPRQVSENISTLSPETRILADDRTNSLLLMGQSSDIEILKQVISQLDIMLSQVMIEAILIEIQLGDDIAYGVDWLQRSFTAVNEEILGPGGGVPVQQPVIGFGGGQSFGTGLDFVDGSEVTRDTPLSPGALTYYATFHDFNLDAVLRLAASSSDAKILSTPVIVTTDNTEASIVVGESRPIVTSTSVTGGGVGRNTFQYRDIAIDLQVTPRINPNNFVVMEIRQTADNVGGFQVIDDNDVPVITRREMEAEIAVEHRSSIVLGGLIGSEERKSRTKIPLLGDIPILGALFRSDLITEDRTELIFIITPYVMTTPEEVISESRRIHERSLGRTDKTWGRTWSDSPIWRAQTEKGVKGTFSEPVLEEERPEIGFEPEGRTPARAVRAMAAERQRTLEEISGHIPPEDPDDGEFPGVDQETDERGTTSRSLRREDVPPIDEMSPQAREDDGVIDEWVDDFPGAVEPIQDVELQTEENTLIIPREPTVDEMELPDPEEPLIPADSKLNFMDPAARSNLVESL